MEHTIANNKIQVSILSTGAEISSIKSLKTNKEYMWNANPDIWGSHAPVLFPIIGSLKNNECTINGSKYKIPKHGIIRHNQNLYVKSKTEDSINFQLDCSEETLKLFPYKFRFNISFILEETKLVIKHSVENLDINEMHFSLGAHPGFNCPLNKDEIYEDYYLEFEKEETAETTLLSASGLISNSTELVLNKSKILPLTSSMFDKDALIFKHLKSKKVSLKSKKTAQVLTVSYNDFSYLGIWAKPNGPFVCIEPWLGIADHENTDGNYLKKDGLISLLSGEIFSAEYSIEIEE